MRILVIFPLFVLIFVQSLFGQESPPSVDMHLYDMIGRVSRERIGSDIKTLADFGTRNTLSDTLSSTRGIGAARRWIKSQFDSISSQCGNCLDVFYQRNFIPKENHSRFSQDVWVVNVVAIQRGTVFPARYVIMSGDIDSRASDVMNFTIDAPGANDNASGMAGTLEAARVLSKYKFPGSIVYLGLSGEEQGLYGGKGMAAYAKNHNWDITGILNNDMIGNIEGIDGVVDNREFRIFSEPVPATETEEERQRRRYTGGEVDGNSRQLARYVLKQANTYMPELKPMMVYRIDRFGRGGHHVPFNDLGYAGVRIMEAHENYTRQHQDVRVENGIRYGDRVAGVDFNYCAKLTAVNVISLASLASAPSAPENVGQGGAVEPNTTLEWTKSEDPNLAGYKIYWRETTEPQWKYSRYVGKTDHYTLTGIIIDNYYFGVAAIGKDGNESVIVFPSRQLRKTND